MENATLHDGHRARMFERLFHNPDSLAEHELLEVILYPMIPRKDTNALAHSLLRVFGNLKNLFAATPQELMSVNGVGKKTAINLCAVGRVLAAVKDDEEKACGWGSFESCAEELTENFKQLNDETFYVFFLDKRYCEIARMAFANNEKAFVSADITELATAMAVHKPSGVLLAHNHPSGNVTPSEADDRATLKISMICTINGTTLLDHVIVSGKNAYSYFKEGRLDYIKQKLDIDNFYID